jgi:hypothetical protein
LAIQKVVLIVAAAVAVAVAEVAAVVVKNDTLCLYIEGIQK